jgi:acetylornithine aminotransferase
MKFSQDTEEADISLLIRNLELKPISSQQQKEWEMVSGWRCLIHPKFQASNGLLGTTFGGNHLACVASIAVLDVMKDENLIENAQQMGEYIENEIKDLPHIKSIRRKGLMIGIELDRDCSEVRKSLLFDHHIFTGNSNDKSVLRILPALNIKKEETDLFINALKTVLENIEDD